MAIDKKTDMAVNHLFNYFKDNDFDQVEALYVMAIYQFLILKRPLECSRRFKLNQDVLKDFKEHL